MNEIVCRFETRVPQKTGTAGSAREGRMARSKQGFGCQSLRTVPSMLFCSGRIDVDRYILL